MKECIDIKKGVGGCLLCTTSSSIWTFARPRFSCIIPYTLITGKCINVQARIKNCTGFNEREEKIKVESWLGKTIFPSLLHYAQIEMRFLFNEIMHEARGKKSMAFFPVGWFVKELNEIGLGGFSCVRACCCCCFVSNRSNINQPARIFRFSDKIG